MTADAHSPADQAAGLAASAQGDPERDQAFAHARTCARCAQALAEGEQLVSLLGRLPASSSPSPEVLQRASAQILAEFEANIVHNKRRNRLSLRVVPPLASSSRMTFRVNRRSIGFAKGHTRYRTYTFTPADGATVVSQRMEYELKFGPLGKLMDAVMVRRKWDAGIKGFFTGLKHYVETGSPPPGKA